MLVGAPLVLVLVVDYVLHGNTCCFVYFGANGNVEVGLSSVTNMTGKPQLYATYAVVLIF